MHGREAILCVANLPHAAQGVALDLPPFRGRIPVELLDGSSFPAAGEGRYPLTLPGYDF